MIRLVKLLRGKKLAGSFESVALILDDWEDDVLLREKNDKVRSKVFGEGNLISEVK